MPTKAIRLLPGSSNPELFEAVCKILSKKPVPVKIGKFANKETSVHILESVRQTDVFILQSGAGQVNDICMETFILASACKTASACRIVAVLPYFPYSKQSKQKRRGCVPAKLVADMLKVAGVTHVVTLDLHHMQMQGFFDIPIDNVKISPLLLTYIRRRVDNFQQVVIVAKNAGASKRAALVAKRLKADYAMIFGEETSYAESLSEERLGEEDGSESAARNETSETADDPEELVMGDGIVGNVKDKVCIVVDDIIDTASPFVIAASLLIRGGASKVIIMATHGLFSGDALQQLDGSKDISEIVVTNSIPQSQNLKNHHKLVAVDCSPILAEAIRRVYYEESVASIYGDIFHEGPPLRTFTHRDFEQHEE